MKKAVRRSVSVLLSVLMVVSMFTIGIVSAGAAGSLTFPTGDYFFDNSLTKWSTVKMVIGHEGYRQVLIMTSVDGTSTFKCTVSPDWVGATQCYFTDAASITTGSINVETGKTGNYTAATTTVPSSSTRLYVPTKATGANIPGSWTKISTPCPTSVLNGSNIMFYIGTNYTVSGGLALYDPSSSSYINPSLVSGISSIDGVTIAANGFGIVTVPGNKAYNVTNNKPSWTGVAVGTPVGGGAYVIGGTPKTVAPTTITNVVSDAGDKIMEGTQSIKLTATVSKATSSVGLSQTIQYYDAANKMVIESGNVSGTSAAVTIDTSSYKAGDTITLKSVLFDGNVYTLGPVKTITVEKKAEGLPTDIKISASSGEIFVGNGTKSSPFSYYSNKTVSLTASATAPEGATLEYAFGGSLTTPPADAAYSANTTYTMTGDSPGVIKTRYVFVRAVSSGGEKSEPVSLEYATTGLRPAVEVTSTFPDGVGQNTAFDLNVNLTNVFPFTGYGNVTINVTEGENIIGTATVKQSDLLAAGTASASVSCVLPSLGSKTLSVTAQYEGITSAAATTTVLVYDPNAQTETLNLKSKSTMVFADTKNTTAFNTANVVPYIHMWTTDTGTSVIPTSEKDPRTAMTAVPSYANMYYFKLSSANETALGTRTMATQLLRNATWDAIGARFTTTGQGQMFANTITQTACTSGEFTPITLKSITGPTDLKQGQEYNFIVSAEGGLPWYMATKRATDASYKLKVTATLDGTETTIVNNKAFAYTADSAAYSFNWTPAVAGSYTLTYTLSDADGLDSVVYTKALEVTGLTPPVVSGVTPESGSVFHVGQSFDVTVTTDTAPQGVTNYYQFSGTGVKTEDQTAGTNNTITVTAASDMVGQSNQIDILVWARDAEGNESAKVHKTVLFSTDYTDTQKAYNNLSKFIADNPIKPAMEQYASAADWTAFHAKLAQADELMEANPQMPAYTVVNEAFGNMLAEIQPLYTQLLSSASYPTVDMYVGSAWYHSDNTPAWDRTDVVIKQLPADYIGPMLAEANPAVQGIALDLGKKTTLSDGRQMYMYKAMEVPAGAKFVLSDTQAFSFPAAADAMTAAQGKTFYVYNNGTDNAIVTINAMSISAFAADTYEVLQGEPVTLTATDTILGGSMTTSVGAAITQSFYLEDGTPITLTNGKWDTTKVDGGTYKIFVSQTDANGIIVKSDKFVTIKVTLPTVYTAPAAVSATADADVYYAGDNIVVTAAASGATYWLGSETEADAKDYDTLEGATYTYELYNGTEKIDETTGLAGTNATFTINNALQDADYNLTVKAFPTLSHGTPSTTTTSAAVTRTVKAIAQWDTAAQAFEVQKNAAAVTDLYANNGAYVLLASGVTATAHGSDATVSYRYSVTNKTTSEQEILTDVSTWTPSAAGTYTIVPVAVITYSGTEYTQALTAAEVTVKANKLNDPALTGTMDGTTVNTAAAGVYDLKNYPQEDSTKGNFVFSASAAVTEPADASTPVTYSYTLKENSGAPAEITDADGNDSTLSFNIKDKCTAGNTYELTVSAQYATNGITQTKTKTYTFTVKDTSKLVTVFIGGPTTWGDKIQYIVEKGGTIADKQAGTKVGTFKANNAISGPDAATFEIYSIQIPAGTEFYLANTVVFDPSKISTGVGGLFTAEEGIFCYIFGMNSINSAYESAATKINDFKVSAIEGGAITETNTVSAALNDTLTFKNILSNKYASYQTPVRVDYYVGDHKIASSADAASTTVTADFKITNTPDDPTDIDFEIGKTYTIKAVVTEGNYNLKYENTVTLTVTKPTASISSMTKSQVFSGEYLPVTVTGKNMNAGAGYRVIESDGNKSYLNLFTKAETNNITITNLKEGQSKIVNVYDADGNMVLSRLYTRGTDVPEHEQLITRDTANDCFVYFEVAEDPVKWKTPGSNVSFELYDNYASSGTPKVITAQMQKLDPNATTYPMTYYCDLTYEMENQNITLENKTYGICFFDNNGNYRKYSASGWQSPPYGDKGMELFVLNPMNSAQRNYFWHSNDGRTSYTGTKPVIKQFTTIAGSSGGAGLAATSYDIMRGQSITIYGIDYANSLAGALAHQNYTLTYSKDGGAAQTVPSSDYTIEAADNNKLNLVWTAGTDAAADGEYVFTLTGKNADGTDVSSSIEVVVGESSSQAPTKLTYTGVTSVEQQNEMNLSARATGGTRKLHFDFYLQYLDENKQLVSESLAGSVDTQDSYNASITITAPQQTEHEKYYKVRVVAYSIDPDTPQGSERLETTADITVLRSDYNKIYFDPSGLTKYINTESDGSQTVKLVTANGRSITMINDSVTVDNGVFSATVTDQELQGDMVFGETARVIADAPMKSGYIFTLDNGNGNQWASYRTNSNETIDVDFTKENPNGKYIFFDNTAAQWSEVWLYSWGGFGGDTYNGDYGVINLGTAQTVKLKELADRPGIFALELPEGAMDSWANDATKTQGFLFIDRSGSAFGKNYVQSIDIKKWDGTILADNATGTTGANILASPKFDFPGNYINDSIQYPFFKIDQWAKINNADTEGSTSLSSYRYRGYIEKMYDFTEMEVNTQAVTFYVDAHTGTDASILLNRTSTAAGYTFPTPYYELIRSNNGTVYTGTFQVPVNAAGEITANFSVTVGDTTYTAGGANFTLNSAKALSSHEAWVDLPSRAAASGVTENQANVIAYKHSTTQYNSSTGGSVTNIHALLTYTGMAEGTNPVQTGIVSSGNGITTLIYAYPEYDDAGAPTVRTTAAATQNETEQNYYKFNGWYKGQLVVQPAFDDDGNQQLAYVYTPEGTETVLFTTRFSVKSGADKYNTYFIMTKEMLNDPTNPWTADGIRWEAFNQATNTPEVLEDSRPVDIKPNTIVNGIKYDIDGYIFKATYHSNIGKIRFFMEGQEIGNDIDGYSKLSTRYLDVTSGKRHEKAYYILDYSKYSASPTIATGTEGWYNLKYTTAFQYPKETERFYQQGDKLTHDQLNSSNSITKRLELYVSAELAKVYPRVNSRFNEYVWPTVNTIALDGVNTPAAAAGSAAAIIPTTVRIKQNSITLINTPEDVSGIEVSAGTINSSPEIRSISSKPIEGGENVPYYIYQDANKLSARIEYMFGVSIVAPLQSKDKDGNDCDFVGWYDTDKKQFICYTPRFSTVVTNPVKLMPVYSDNTTLNVLNPQAVIDGVSYETFVQSGVEKVNIRFATRVITPPTENYSNLKFFVQRIVKRDDNALQESDWSAPIDLTSQLNKDKRVNYMVSAKIYNAEGAVDNVRCFVRAYVQYTDKDGQTQKAYSNVEVGSPEFMSGSQPA